MKKPPRRSGNFVWDRPGTDVFWFSRAVPKAQWEAEGRRVIQFSLRTRDRRDAEVEARRIASELDVRWGLNQLPRRVPTELDLEEAAVILGYDLVREAGDERRTALAGMGDSMWQAHADWSQQVAAAQARATATGDRDAVRDLADEAIDALGFDLPPESEGYAKLCELLNVARMAGVRVNLARARGDVESGSDSKLVDRVRKREAARAKPKETLSDLFELWAEEQLAKGEKRADTINQDRKKIAQFATFVGVDRAVNSIRPVEVAEYRDTLRNLPPKWRNKKGFANLGMREAAAKAQELDLPKTAFTTVNSHLSVVSPLYDWLRSHPAWAGMANPCSGLFYARVKGKNPRPPFTTEHLNTIISSPLFTGFAADGREHEQGNMHAEDWRKWLPLVAMFTGARIGEVAQLRIGDVRQEHGAWFIHIRHDEAEGLATKSGRSRPAAVHSRLEEIGFIKFVQQRREAANINRDAPLFAELSKNDRGQSGKASRFWRDYLTAIGIKDGRDGYGSHSFRHTLADRLRSEAEVLDDQIEVCLGHNQKTVTSGYGALGQGTVTMLKGWIEAVRFDGVDFSNLTVPMDA